MSLKFNQKSFNYFFTTSIMLNILLHYFKILDIGGHEEGNDSWDYHAFCGQLLYDGKANWILDPLGYFGLYPPNIEPGIIFFFATFSSVLGINLTSGVLYLSLYLGIFLCFQTFILGKELFSKHVALVCCFVIPSSNLLIAGTTWIIYSRGLATIMSIPVLYLLFKKDIRRFSQIILILILLFATISIHRLGFLFIIAIIFPAILSIFYHYVRPKHNPFNFYLIIPYILLGLLLFYGTFKEYWISYEYIGERSPGSNFISSFITLGYSYATIFGLSLLFIPFGILGLFNKILSDYIHKFLLVNFLIFIIFIYDTQYLLHMFLPILLLLSSYGFYYLIILSNQNFSKVFSIFTFFIIIFSFGLAPFFITIQDVNSSDSLKTTDRWETAFFIKENTNREDLMIHGFGIQLAALDAISGRPSLNEKDINSLEQRVVDTEIILEDILVTKDLYYVIPTKQNVYYFEHDNFQSKKVLDTYPHSYLVSNKNYPNIPPGDRIEYVTFVDQTQGVIESPFMTSIDSDKYKIFSTDDYQIFFIQ